jgi:hypothetical protein
MFRRGNANARRPMWFTLNVFSRSGGLDVKFAKGLIPEHQ